MAAKSNNDPNTPDLSAFSKLSDSQIQSMLMSRAGTPLSADQAKSQVAFYKQNPAQLAGMTLGGTYTPNSPGATYGAGSHGQAGLSGGTTTGGISALDFANMVQGFAPQQPQAQQPQYQPQMPQLAPRQPMPTVQTTPLTPTPQMPMTAPPTMNVPQANASATAPLFSLGQLPQAQNPLIQPPTQRFQEGGQVQGQPMTDPFTGQPLTGQDVGYANLGLYHAYPTGSAQQNAINQMGSPVQLGNLYQPQILGAAATDTAPIIQLPPSGEPSSKSGVAPTPGALVGTGVPQIPQGPWLTNPSVFAKAPMPTLNQPVGWTGSPTAPLTPTPQANAAQMPQMPVTPAGNAATATPTQVAQQPSAIAPPAPGVNIGAHTSALANAGMAIYAHYGGDPSTASHEDITNFHNQLLSHLGGSAPGATTPPAAAGRAPSAPAAPAPVKMQTGGVVPDYWHPNPRPQQPARMQQPQQPQQPQQVPQSDSSWSADGQDTQGQGASQGTSQGPAGSSYNQAIQNAIQARNAYAAADKGFSAMGTGGYGGGGGGMTVGDVAGGAAMPGAGVTQSLGQAPAANAQALGASSAIGGLASGLSAAAQAYADSIKPWRMQPSHIPDPSSFQRNQQINLGSVPT
jgi:hypothetical protein